MACHALQKRSAPFGTTSVKRSQMRAWHAMPLQESPLLLMTRTIGYIPVNLRVTYAHHMTCFSPTLWILLSILIAR